MKNLYFVFVLMVCSSRLIGMENAQATQDGLPKIAQSRKINEYPETYVDDADCTRTIIMVIASIGIIVYVSILDLISDNKQEDKLA